jgi:galactitol-specific phosphotransferase system IIC component
VFYILLDVMKLGRAASFLVPAGRNPLMAYLLPDQFGNLVLLLGGLLHINLWRAFWPFAEKGGIAGMLNAAIVTAFVLFLTTLLTRAKVILKL